MKVKVVVEKVVEEDDCIQLREKKEEGEKGCDLGCDLLEIPVKAVVQYSLRVLVSVKEWGKEEVKKGEGR